MTGLLVAKWLHLPVLLDPSEMAALLEELKGVRIYLGSRVVPLGKEELSHEEFLQVYRGYIDQLRQGESPDLAAIRDSFSTFWTTAPEQLYRIDLSEGRAIVRASRPVIQLQLHQIGYSSLDGKFRSMVFGKESLSWGIQFSYPQLYQDGESKRFYKVDESDDFPNTALFRQLQRWMRLNSRPTPFEVGGQRSNEPIRLGKSCFSWINRHPQLAQHGIRVGDAS